MANIKRSDLSIRNTASTVDYFVILIQAARLMLIKPRKCVLTQSRLMQYQTTYLCIYRSSACCAFITTQQ